MEYRHTQIGWIMIGAIAVALIFLGATKEAAGSMHVVPMLLVIAILSLFCSLTVEIKDGAVNCRFGLGVIRRRFLLTEITGVQSVRNPWYAGWGIRWRPGQYWLWNVSGLGAVELTLRSGKRFRIGTDEPEALVQAIRTNQSTMTNEQ